MSTVDISCYAISPEKDSGDGEINCYKSLSCENTETSHAVVSEIMNEIIDNAFEVIVANSLQKLPKFEKITPSVVGDILENILSPSSDNDASKPAYRHDETALLDDEIKQIIKEMKFPVEQKNIICTQGVGDQLGDKEEVKPDKIIAEPAKRNTLERKSRLTNLVRNSKQMLAKLVVSDHENVLKLSRSEEAHEKILRVIDLEKETGSEPGQANAGEGCCSKAAEPGFAVQLPSETAMDTVNLRSKTPPPKIIEREQEEDEEREIASCSFAKIEHKKSSVIKKKWNFGAKIMKYLKRRPKKE